MKISPRWRLVLAVALLGAAPSAGAAQQAAGDRPLSLADAISEALAGNAGLAVAQAEADVARADVGTASSYLWPRVDVSTGWTRSNDPVFAFGTKLRQGIFTESDLALDALNDPDAIDDWASAATLQWKLLSPQVWAGRSAASSAADAADWKATRAREATILRTEVLYYDAQRAAAQTQAALRSEEAARSARNVFERREAEGVLTRAEVLQAEADLQGATAARIDAERREADAYRRLAVFLGWGPEVRPVLTDTLQLVSDESPAGEAVIPAGFDAAQRADLQAMEKARDAAATNSSRARLGFLPELDAFAGYSMHGSSLFANDGDNWTGGLALRWNVFSGLSRSAETKRADARRTMAEVQYDEAMRSARAEVQEAADAVDAARRAAGAAVVADSAASLGRDLMQMRFEEGLATANDLLAADSRAAQARGRAIDASAAYRMAQARLRFVTTQHTSE